MLLVLHPSLLMADPAEEPAPGQVMQWQPALALGAAWMAGMVSDATQNGDCLEFNDGGGAQT